LEIGADDYIAKPFSPRELLARVNSILRRTDKQKTDAHTTLDFENVVLNLDKKVVFVDKKEVFLTSHEFHLLKKIMEEKGKVVSRETLMREVM
jgi:two-component system alkaline phosphatase synthesis response regulator PhoP